MVVTEQAMFFIKNIFRYIISHNKSVSHTHIFHVVLDPILLEVGGRLCPVEPLGRIHVRLLKVVPVDLQLVVRVGAQVHCSGTKHGANTQTGYVDRSTCVGRCVVKEFHVQYFRLAVVEK